MSYGFVVFPDPMEIAGAQAPGTDENVQLVAGSLAAPSANRESTVGALPAGLELILARLKESGASELEDALAQAIDPGEDMPALITTASASAAKASEVTLFGFAGAALFPSLSVDQRRRLRGTGLRVVANRRVFRTPPSSFIEAAGPVDPAAATAEAWHLEAIGARSLHQRGFQGQGQMIGIMDTGIDASHPEFAGKLVEYAEFDPLGRIISNVARDLDVHGTHVAALAAGRTMGAAPQASLAVAAVLTYRTSKGMSGTVAQILGGLQWLVAREPENGDTITVINASLGGPPNNDYLYSTVRSAREDGIAFVASIGNEGENGENSHRSPGDYDVTVGVGAHDRNRRIASFSSWGSPVQHQGLSKPDLSAPGVQVVSAIPGGRFASMPGTSMASPLVAGALALIRQGLGEQDVDALVQVLYERHLEPAQPPSAHRAGRGCLVLDPTFGPN